MTESSMDVIVGKGSMQLLSHCVTLLPNNAVYKHCMSILRDKERSGKDKRNTIRFLFSHIAIQACAILKTKGKVIDTGVATTTVEEIIQDIVVIEILRAGDVPAQGLIADFDLLPGLKVHISTIWEKRDEDTLEADVLGADIPAVEGALYLIIDPMKATGGSMVGALDRLLKRLETAGVNWKECNFATITLMETAIGIKRVHAHPLQPKQFSAVQDTGLTEKGYITPGGGDLGDELCKA